MDVYNFKLNELEDCQSCCVVIVIVSWAQNASENTGGLSCGCRHSTHRTLNASNESSSPYFRLADCFELWVVHYALGQWYLHAKRIKCKCDQKWCAYEYFDRIWCIRSVYNVGCVECWWHFFAIYLDDCSLFTVHTFNDHSMQFLVAHHRCTQCISIHFI